MKPFPHRYEVRIASGSTGQATLASAGVADLAIDAPVEFDGPGDAWSPDSSCSARSRPVSCSRSARSHARRRSNSRRWRSTAREAWAVRTAARFTEIVLRPRVALPAGVDSVRVRRAFDKAGKACLVSTSLSTPVLIEPEVAG